MRVLYVTYPWWARKLHVLVVFAAAIVEKAARYHTEDGTRVYPAWRE